MTYSDLVDYLKAKALIVNATGTFVHGKKPDASLISSCTAYPLIWLSPFIENTDRIKGTIVRKVAIGFFAQDSPQNTLEERQALIQTMWDLKEDYMNAIFNDIPRTISATLENSTPMYFEMAGTISGYLSSFNIQSKIPC